jgi:hypothetical protein
MQSEVRRGACNASGLGVVVVVVVEFGVRSLVLLLMIYCLVEPSRETVAGDESIHA